MTLARHKGYVSHIGTYVCVYIWSLLEKNKAGKTKKKRKFKFKWENRKEILFNITAGKKFLLMRVKRRIHNFTGLLFAQKMNVFDVASVSEEIQLLQLVHPGHPCRMQMFSTLRNRCLCRARGSRRQKN